MKLFSETIEDYFTYLEKQKIPYFAFLASGVVFLCSRNDEKDKNKIFEALLLGAKFKAKISPTLGYGFTRKDFLEKGEANLLMRVKSRHDPLCKFNRNKFLECPTKNHGKISEEVNEEQEKGTQEKSKEETEEKTSEVLKEDYKIIEEKEKSEEEVKKLNNEEEQTPLTKPEQDEIRVNNKQDEIRINKSEKADSVNAQDLINQAELFTLRKPDELTKEQKEQVKKIAAGFFGGGEKNPEDK